MFSLVPPVSPNSTHTHIVCSLYSTAVILLKTSGHVPLFGILHWLPILLRAKAIVFPGPSLLCGTPSPPHLPSLPLSGFIHFPWLTYSAFSYTGFLAGPLISQEFSHPWAFALAIFSTWKYSFSSCLHGINLTSYKSLLR